MGDFNANLGQIKAKEVLILVGNGPHVLRTESLKAGQADLSEGLVVSLDAAKEVVPYDEAQSFAAGSGDGAEKDFSGTLGPIEPGSLSVADGTETFSDDGFGNLTGDTAGTGKVNYATGAFSVSFNAAPANEAAVAAGYKPIPRGVLPRKAAADAGICDVVVFGMVNRAALKVGAVEPTAAQLLALDRLGIWALG